MAVLLLGIVLALVHCSCVTVVSPHQLKKNGCLNCIVVHTMTFQVWANYTVQVAVLEYIHLDSKLRDGNCCNLNCSGSCNSTFHFCLREGKCTSSDGCQCNLGLITTDHSPINASYVTFSIGDKLVDNILNPINFEVTEWKVILYYLHV